MTSAFNTLRKTKTGTSPKFAIELEFEDIWSNDELFSVDYDPDQYSGTQTFIFDLVSAGTIESTTQYNTPHIGTCSTSVIVDDSNGVFADLRNKMSITGKANIYMYYDSFEDFQNKGSTPNNDMLILQGTPITPIDYEYDQRTFSFDIVVQTQNDTLKDFGYVAAPDVSPTYTGTTTHTFASDWFGTDSMQERPFTFGSLKKGWCYPITQVVKGTVLSDWKPITRDDIDRLISLGKQWVEQDRKIHPSNWTSATSSYSIPSQWWSSGPANLSNFKNAAEPDESRSTLQIATNLANQIAEIIDAHPYVQSSLETLLGYTAAHRDYMAIFGQEWQFFGAAGMSYRPFGEIDEWDRLTNTNGGTIYFGVTYSLSGSLTRSMIVSGNMTRSWGVIGYNGCMRHRYTDSYYIIPIYSQSTIFRGPTVESLINSIIAADRPVQIEVKLNNDPTITYDTSSYSAGSQMTFSYNAASSYYWIGRYIVYASVTGSTGPNGGILYNVSSISQQLASKGEAGITNGMSMFHQHKTEIIAAGDHSPVAKKYYAYKTTQGIRELTEITDIGSSSTADELWDLGNMKLGNVSTTNAWVLGVNRWYMEASGEGWEPTVYVDTFDHDVWGSAENTVVSGRTSWDGSYVTNNHVYAIKYLLGATADRFDGNDLDEDELRLGADNSYPFGDDSDNCWYVLRSGDVSEQTAAELAFHGRLAIWNRFGSISESTYPVAQTKLRYLSREQAYDTFHSDETEHIKIGYSDVLEPPVRTNIPFEDLTSKYIFKWREDLLSETVERETEVKFGLTVANKEESIDLWSVHNHDLARKIACFWAIRAGLPWVLVSVVLPLPFCALDLYDTVELNLPNELFVDSVKGEVRQLSFDTDNLTITAEIWTPLVEGMFGVFPNAWPSFYDDATNYSDLKRNV